jgi:hypothetical protein
MATENKKKDYKIIKHFGFLDSYKKETLDVL